MKEKVVKSIREVEYKNKKYTIMVYGTINETKESNGFYVIPVTYKNNKVKKVSFGNNSIIPGFNQLKGKTKEFNMGWSICSEPDVFDYDKGVEICKRRFSKSPMTTQNGRFLTPDMCQAIVDNEVDFIYRNIDKFLPPQEETEDNQIAVIKDGDYVSFIKNGIKYVGIFKEYSYGGMFFDSASMKFYFLGSVTDNGLVDHNDIMFFRCFDGFVKLNKATDDEKTLIDAYLKGAHYREWDSNTNSFKLLID